MKEKEGEEATQAGNRRRVPSSASWSKTFQFRLLFCSPIAAPYLSSRSNWIRIIIMVPVLFSLPYLRRRGSFQNFVYSALFGFRTNENLNDQMIDTMIGSRIIGANLRGSGHDGLSSRRSFGTFVKRKELVKGRKINKVWSGRRKKMSRFWWSFYEGFRPWSLLADWMEGWKTNGQMERRTENGPTGWKEEGEISFTPLNSLEEKNWNSTDPRQEYETRETEDRAMIIILLLLLLLLMILAFVYSETNRSRVVSSPMSSSLKSRGG